MPGEENFVVGTWTSPNLTPPTGGWTVLEWSQTTPGGSMVFLDVLDTDGNNLVRDLSGSPQTIGAYAAVLSTSIKLKYRLYALEETPTVDNINLWGQQQPLTNTGRNQIVRMLASAGATGSVVIAVGSGSTAFSPTMTSMVSEIARITIGTVNTATTKFLRLEATMGVGTLGGNVITEMGIWNTGSSGQLFAYRTFSAYTLSSTLQAKLRWDFNFYNQVPIMNDGVTHIRSLLANQTTSLTQPTHVLWGNFTGTISATTYSSMPNQLTATSIFITSAINNVYTADATLSPTALTGNTMSIGGLMNATGGGTLFMLQEHASIVKSTFPIQDEFVIRIE